MRDLKPFITERDGVPVTTSRAVAEQFGKSHKHVLEAIDNLTAQLINADQELTEPKNRLSTSLSEEAKEEAIAFANSNFEASEYRDSTGRTLPEYLLTRDGFTLLAMGFTGAKALQFKVAYINAFNRMEMLLRGGISSTALQSIENRLQALEKTAGEGSPEALDKVSEQFLEALQRAIDEGRYILKPRFKNYDVEPSKVLGLEDIGFIAIKTMLAFKLYKEAVKKPLKRLALWGVLEQSGINQRRGIVNIKGNKYSVIYIPSDKLKS